jgi:hypothetical protein
VASAMLRAAALLKEKEKALCQDDQSTWLLAGVQFDAVCNASRRAPPLPPQQASCLRTSPPGFTPGAPSGSTWKHDARQHQQQRW